MRLLLVPDSSSPNGEDAFCREIARRAAARGHSFITRPASAGPVEADAVIINSFQPDALAAARSADRPTFLRLIDSYCGADASALAAAQAGAAACERVLVPSVYLRSVVASWGITPERIRIVPYAYDHVFAQQIALVTLRAVRPSGFGLVTAGVLNEAARSHFEAVLSAAARLRLDWHLAVIGDGPALGALKSRAKSLMVDDRVAFLGDLPHTKKMEYLRAAKAFIDPSGLQGFPSLALYAMSEGCPVIGAAAGALPELLRDGENGLFYRPGDAGALAERISTLAATAGLSLRLIKGGVSTIERHTWDATVAAALDAVENVGAL